jgi:hypothetical protein
VCVDVVDGLTHVSISPSVSASVPDRAQLAGSSILNGAFAFLTASMGE